MFISLRNEKNDLRLMGSIPTSQDAIQVFEEFEYISNHKRRNIICISNKYSINI